MKRNTTLQLLCLLLLLCPVLAGCELDNPFSDDSPTGPRTKAFAGFTWIQEDPTLSAGPVSVKFLDESLNARSFLWDFGDGRGNSRAAEPRHTFGSSQCTVGNPCRFTVSQTVCPSEDFVFDEDVCSRATATVTVPLSGA